MDKFDFIDSAVEAELRSRGVYASVTKGASMRPLFKTNRDVIFLKVPSDELKKYDVVLYKNGAGRYTLHRIVRVFPEGFIIRGDNTYAPERVPKDRIIGVLTDFNRRGKKHSVTDFGYRFYSRLWTFIYPARFLMYKALYLAYRVYKKIFKK